VIKPCPLFDARLIIEALNVPVAIVASQERGASVGDAGLTYYAVSKGFASMYGAVFRVATGERESSPMAWRDRAHVEIFPDLKDPDHEWAIQLLEALTGDSSGWVDVAWNPESSEVITVAYQLTCIAPGWAGIEAVDLAGHATRILGKGLTGD